MKTDFRRDAKVLLFDTECFRGDVEILTEDGFIRFDQLGDEKVAQYHEDGSIDFVKPIRKIKKEYKGGGVSFSTNRGSIVVTENHTMISRKQKTGEIRKTLAKDFCWAQDRVLFAGQNNKCRKLTSEDRLAISLQADGHLVSSGVKTRGWGKGEPWAVWFVQFHKDGKAQRMRQILEAINWQWTSGVSIRNNGQKVVWFRIHTPITMTKNLETWFKIPDCGEDFLQEIGEWDGTKYNAKKKNRITYYSTNLANTLFVQSVAICNNRNAQWSLVHRTLSKHKDLYALRIGTRIQAHSGSLRKKGVYLNEMVYCVEVPTNMIIVRGGQQTLVTGNCSPSRGWFYGQYETNPIKVEQPPLLLAISWKWLGDKGKAQGATLFDFPQKDRWDDDGLVRKLWSLMDEANIIVAHNLKRFDEKMANGFFLRHSLTPPSSSKTVDTLQVARRYFKLDNNRLDYLGKLLFGEGKTETTYKDCWDKMLNGNEKEARKYAKLMDAYCRNDTDLLEKIYNKMLPWDKTHPNMALFAGQECICPKCGHSSHFRVKSYRRTGTQINAVQYLCTNCNSYVTRKLEKYERDELKEQGKLTSVFRNVI